MELQKELLPIFHIYQCGGFAPFRIPLDRVNQKMKWYIVNGVLTAFLAFLAIYDIILYKRFFESNDESKMISYLSTFITTIMRWVALVVIVEAFLQRKQQIRFLRQFDRMDQLFTEELGVCFDYKKIRRNAYIWMTSWLLQLIILTMLILLDFIVKKIGFWLTCFYLFCTLPLFLPSTRYFQIIHYIQLLGFCFEMISTRLDEFQCQTNRLSVGGKRKKNSNKIDDRTYDEIVALRRIYHILWESVEQLNKMFQWSLLLLIGSSFFIIVVNFYRTLYWILTPDPSKLELIITFFIWSLVHTFHFISLSSVCHNISQQVVKGKF